MSILNVIMLGIVCVLVYAMCKDIVYITKKVFE